MIDLVLATDMKQHFALLSQFKAMSFSTSGPDSMEKSMADSHQLLTLQVD
jgi:hypothetical protein